MVLDYLSHDALAELPIEPRDHWLRMVIEGVALAPDTLTVRLDADQITALKEHSFQAMPGEPPAHPTCPYQPEVEDRGRLIHLVLKIQIKKLDGRRLLLSPDGQDLVIPSRPEPKRHIVEAIGLAYRWHDDLLRTGLQIRDYAATNNLGRTRILKLLPLTQLGPDILKRALAGTLPSRITLDDLRTAARQLDWDRQTAELGIESETDHRRAVDPAA